MAALMALSDAIMAQQHAVETVANSVIDNALGLFAPHHSFLNATTGLTRVARRAGM
jgi:ATP-dependent Clp protease ATP-binding subunit ClpA